LKRFKHWNFRHKWALPAHEWQRFEELSMSITNGEAQMKNLTDEATYERLEKDVTAVKNDIAALTDQITDALNAFAGTAQKQARRGYKQAPPMWIRRSTMPPSAAAPCSMRRRMQPIRSRRRWKTSSRSARLPPSALRSGSASSSARLGVDRKIWRR